MVSHAARIVVVAMALASLGSIAPYGRAQVGKSVSASAAAANSFQQASEFLRKGWVDQAQKSVEQGLKLDPTSVAGNNLLGLIYGREAKYQLSTQAFRKALSVAPHASEILNNLGNSYFLQHKLFLAENEFRDVLRQDPANRNANYNLGLVLLTERRPKEAIRCFGRIHPPDANSMFNLAQAYLQAGDKEKGLATTKRLSDLAKDDVRVHFTLGVMLAGNRQYAAAVQQLEAADALQPGTFEILYDLGQAYLGNGETAKAEAVLAHSLKLHPDSAPALYLLARAYSAERKDLQALELLVKAHRLAPRNTDVIFLMARLSMKQSFYEDAIPLLESGIQIAPNRPDFRAALGECDFMTGKIPQAVQEFKTLIRLDPSAASYAFMGLCYLHLGQFDRAKGYLQEGLKTDPHNAACLYNMGYIANRQGNYLEAERWLERAVEADPNYADALLELATAKMDQKKFADALPLLRKCARLLPRPAPAYYKLATAERSLHETAAAQRDFKVFQTLSRNPHSGPYPYQHLFDYLDQRAGLPVREQSQLDLAQLQQQVRLHPERPSVLYPLAETYLKLGRPEAAERTISQLDRVSQNDFRTEMGIGVLLARYRLYPQAVEHFQRAVNSNPNSDDAWYDLADAYFRGRDYQDASTAIQHVSTQGQKDASYLSLLGDIDARLGRTANAVQAFRSVIAKDPDKDQNYLSLALAYLRSGNALAARQALDEGLSRTPDSGWLFWGKGVVAAVEGKPAQAEQYLKEAMDLLPEWPGGYSTLGVLYYESGQIAKARKVLKQFIQNGPHGALNVQRIEQVLSAAAPNNPGQRGAASLAPQARRQFLEVALSLADYIP